MTSEPLLARHHPGCYPSTRQEALAYFEKVLALKIDSLPPAAGRPAGVIAPHLGPFQLGLASYLAGYQTLLQEPLAETYLILGVGHHSRLEWNLDRRDHITPLGRAECATNLVDALTEDISGRRFFEPGAHEGEHSIEFPLLWLQAIHHLHATPGMTPKPVRFFPILCGGLQAYLAEACAWDDLRDYHDLSAALGKLFQTHAPGQRLRMIVSIDGCHMGPRFQHPYRVTPRILKDTEEWEDALWHQAGGGDARLFLDWLRGEGNDRYFDGVGALALLLAAGERAGRRFAMERTRYDQWFTPRDASVVTCSGGHIGLAVD